MRMITAIAALLFLASQAAGRPAWADCQHGLQQLQTVAEKLQPGRLKTLVYQDVARATQDEAEADEPECTDALEHAQRLLKTMH